MLAITCNAVNFVNGTSLCMNEADPEFASSILSKIPPNRWNCVYWADTNPHLILENELNLPGVMVWADVNERGVVGPFFFEGNVNGQTYLK